MITTEDLKEVRGISAGEILEPKWTKIIIWTFKTTGMPLEDMFRQISEETNSSPSLVIKVLYGSRPVTKFSKQIVNYAIDQSIKISRRNIRQMNKLKTKKS